MSLAILKRLRDRRAGIVTVVVERLSFRERFNRVADATTTALGSLPVLVGSVVLVVIWALTGPLFNFSDTWQLFINTTTTVITFWMVFVIQNSANRASKATQLKLDELIRAVDRARNEFITLDHAPEAVLVEHEKELLDLANGSPAKATIARQKRKTRMPASGGSHSASGNDQSGPQERSSRSLPSLGRQ